MTYQPTPVETERRNRIRLAVFAYAYEYRDVSLISDHEYDAMSRRIDPSIDTGDLEMDGFFLTEFHPDTGVWIRSHPQLKGIQRIYEQVFT